jgi:dynein heavy chain
VLEKFPLSHAESMNAVLVQEMERYNTLLNAIRGDLDTLLKAMQGLTAMSPVLRAICSALVAGKLPATWAKVSYPSVKPLASYVADLLERVRFLEVRNCSECVQLTFRNRPSYI